MKLFFLTWHNSFVASHELHQGFKNTISKAQDSHNRAEHSRRDGIKKIYSISRRKTAMHAELLIYLFIVSCDWDCRNWRMMRSAQRVLPITPKPYSKWSRITCINRWLYTISKAYLLQLAEYQFVGSSGFTTEDRLNSLHFQAAIRKQVPCKWLPTTPLCTRNCSRDLNTSLVLSCEKAATKRNTLEWKHINKANLLPFKYFYTFGENRREKKEIVSDDMRDNFLINVIDLKMN